jgi:predicted N-acetyltransferase YhbS
VRKNPKQQEATTQIEFLIDYPQIIDTIAQWIHTEWGFFPEYSDKKKIIQRYQGSLNKNILPITWVALDNNKVVGCVSIFDYDVAGGKKVSSWLVALYVLNDYRQKGVGKGLVQHAVREATRLGYNKLYLFTGQDSRREVL